MPQLTTEKTFSVSKDRLYQAWTSEEDLKQWWKPLGRQLTSVTNELEKGGTVRYEFDSGDLKIEGQYEEVKQGERLVYTWNWKLPDEAVHNGNYILHISFEGSGDSSTLRVKQENFSDEHSIQPHKEGWEHSLNDLKAYLEGA